MKILLQPGEVSFAQLRGALYGPVTVELDTQCRTAIRASQQAIEDVIKQDKVVYGTNTGFGLLAHVKIAPDQLEALQRNIVRSHAAGVGEYLKPDVVRLLMLLKINSLAQGYSGVRERLVDMLLTLLNNDVLPCIPSKGSVGASGDLAPLAHLTLPLMGEGHVWMNEEKQPAAQALQVLGLKPLSLGPKEGLAMLNGTQVSTALALAAYIQTEALFTSGVIAGCLSIEASMGSEIPFDARIHQVRRQLGQIQVAAFMRDLFVDSEIRKAYHMEKRRVQDPYSLRCQPQVLGACLDNLKHVAVILHREANAVTDNPLIFSADAVLSGGNFHAEPVAMAADILALVIAEIGSFAERQIAFLIDQHMSGLPAFLAPDAGLQSGFMLAHVTAAALASENKSLAHPACVDSLPTSANQEDHVSMATFAARRLHNMLENTFHIVAIDWLAACQGLDFRAPLKSSPTLEQYRMQVRAQVALYHDDRILGDDISKVYDLLRQPDFIHIPTEWLAV